VAKGGKKLSDIDRVPAMWPDNETTRNDLLDYAFEIEHFDQHLGRMLAELEKRGLLETARRMCVARSLREYSSASRLKRPKKTCETERSA